MLKFGRAAALPSVVTYAPGDVEEAFFAAAVPLHLLFFHAAPVAPAVLDDLTRLGKELRGRAAVATIDTALHKEVTAFFDVAPVGSVAPPALVGFSLTNGTKYMHTGELVYEAMADFAKEASRGAAVVHLRSKPPIEATGLLVELVGSTFPKVAHDPAKDVLVHFYSPSCGHCRKLEPVFEAVAAKFSEDDDMVVAKIDAVHNDVLGLEPEGFPTIVLYPKANKRGVEYDGSRDLHDLVQFVDDARAGRNHIGGLPGGRLGEEQPDEDDGYRVEL